MKTEKHILVKYETVKRTEKVKYLVQIPEHIRNKITYADKQIESGDYISYEVADIVNSEMLDEEIIALKKVSLKTKLSK